MAKEAGDVQMLVEEVSVLWGVLRGAEMSSGRDD